MLTAIPPFPSAFAEAFPALEPKVPLLVPSPRPVPTPLPTPTPTAIPKPKAPYPAPVPNPNPNPIVGRNYEKSGFETLAYLLGFEYPDTRPPL
jgi:hypothetical protein